MFVGFMETKGSMKAKTASSQEVVNHTAFFSSILIRPKVVSIVLQ